MEEIVGVSSLLDCNLRVEESTGMSSLLLVLALDTRRFLASAAPPEMVRAITRKEHKFIMVSLVSVLGAIIRVILL